MHAIKVFRIAGYVPDGRGQYAARLEAGPVHLAFNRRKTACTTLWSGRHDEGEEGLRRALLHPGNVELLRFVAARPHAEVEWSAGPVGGASEVDALALLRDPDGRRHLMIVDCELAGGTKPSRLRAQYTQALRNSRAVLAQTHVAAPEPSPSLVLLAGWRPGLPLPQARHRPAWNGVQVPRPRWWGYLPFRLEDDEYVVFGRWQVLDGEGWVRAAEQRNSEWFSTELKGLMPSSRPMRAIEYPVALGKGSALVFLLNRGPFRARLRVMSPKHKRALLPPGKEDEFVAQIRRLRAAAYSGGWAPTGWEFLGETIEDGAPWLTWQWMKPAQETRVDWVSANSEAETFAITLKMFTAGG